MIKRRHSCCSLAASTRRCSAQSCQPFPGPARAHRHDRIKTDHCFSPRTANLQAGAAEILDSCSDIRCRRWRPAQFRGRSVSPALPCISLRIGRKAPQERFSEEVSESFLHPETNFSTAQLQFPCYTLAEECNIQQAWMNSRNPTNIASRIEHRQHHLPASQYRAGKR